VDGGEAQKGCKRTERDSLKMNDPPNTVFIRLHATGLSLAAAAATARSGRKK